MNASSDGEAFVMTEITRFDLGSRSTSNVRPGTLRDMDAQDITLANIARLPG